MSQDVVAAEKTENTLQKLYPIPTKRNMEMYELYVEGKIQSEIAELYNTTTQNVNMHLKRVREYFDRDWRTIQQNRLKLKNDKVLESFDELIENRNPQVTINHLNKLVYPNQIDINQTTTTVNVTAIKVDLSINDDVYDDNVVETESQVVGSVTDSNSNDNSQTETKQGTNSHVVHVNQVLGNE